MSTSTTAPVAPAPVPVTGRRTGARGTLRPPAALDPGRISGRFATSDGYGPWLLAVAFTALYAADSIIRYEQFRTMSWDLGLFTEVVKQYAHGHAPIVDARAPGFDLLGEHFHPILALLGPLFAIWPSPTTLLLAQAVLFGCSIVPVTRLARDFVSRRGGYVVGAAYGTSFGVVQAVDFDFHELAFAVPLIAFALSALLRDRPRVLLLCCCGLLCTKEEFGITVVMPLGVAWVLQDRTRWRNRLPLAFAGLVGSLLQILWLIPDLNPHHVYGFLTTAGSAGNAGNVEGLAQLAAGLGQKAHLLLLLGMVTGFTALLSPLVLLAVPDLLMRFASSDPSYWGTWFHYNSVLMPILFVAAVDGLARRSGLRRTLWRIPLRATVAGPIAIAAAALWMFPDYAVGQFLSATPEYGPSQTHITALRDAIAEVPAGTTVEGDIDVLAPLAAKTDAFWMGNAEIDPVVDYVVLDTQLDGYDGKPGAYLLWLEDGWHQGATYSVLSSDDGVFVLRHV